MLRAVATGDATRAHFKVRCWCSLGFPGFWGRTLGFGCRRACLFEYVFVSHFGSIGFAGFGFEGVDSLLPGQPLKAISTQRKNVPPPVGRSSGLFLRARVGVSRGTTRPGSSRRATATAGLGTTSGCPVPRSHFGRSRNRSRSWANVTWKPSGILGPFSGQRETQKPTGREDPEPTFGTILHRCPWLK